MRTTVTAERWMDARPDVIYHLVADYREHHRLGGFLPPAYSELDVLQGGVGDGTEIRFTIEMGRQRRTVTASVTEPDPGRTLVETSPGLETTFTVAPSGSGATVRFDTVLDEPGIQGLLTRLFAGGILKPIFTEELERLELSAQGHR